MTVLFSLVVCVLDSLDKIYARALCSRETCTTSTYSNSFILACTSLMYSCKYSSLTWYSPVTWEATSWESVQILIILAPMSVAILSSAKKASFLAVLFVITKDRPKDTSITNPSSFSIITLAWLPFELDDPSTYTIHIPSLFRPQSRRTLALSVLFWIRNGCRTRIVQETISSSFQWHPSDPKFIV